MNPRNSIWHDVPALNEYVARCQSVLQSGKSDNDILLYWPISDFWHNPSGRLQPMTVSQTGWFEDQPIGKTAHELWNRGYAFDYVSDRQLQTAKVKNGEVQMPGGNYKVIVVPQCKYIPLETFKKLVALAENGATVIFEKQLPAEVSGWGDLEKRQAEFRTAYDKVVMKFPEDSSQIGKSMASIGKGQLWVGKLEWLLDCCRVPREMLTDAGFSFVRRSFDGGWYYFIANRGENNFDGWVTLGRTAKSVVILDPMTGNSGVAASRQSADSIQVRLQLQAGESAILARIRQSRSQRPGLELLADQRPAG